MEANHPQPLFVPMLYLNDLSAAINFYKKAFGAVEEWRIRNPDGTTHVAELSISSALFRMHEVTSDREASPSSLKTTTVEIDMLVGDPDALATRAVKAGATLVSPVKDFEYGFRQGIIKDPFGHKWCLEKYDGSKKVPLMP